MNQRQADRRHRFQAAFTQMPLWEVWTTTHQAYTGFFDVLNRPEIIDVKRNHVKSIPRRLRRTMARARAKREWQAMKGGN